MTKIHSRYASPTPITKRDNDFVTQFPGNVKISYIRPTEGSEK